MFFFFFFIDCCIDCCILRCILRCVLPYHIIPIIPHTSLCFAMILIISRFWYAVLPILFHLPMALCGQICWWIMLRLRMGINLFTEPSYTLWKSSHSVPLFVALALALVYLLGFWLKFWLWLMFLGLLAFLGRPLGTEHGRWRKRVEMRMGWDDVRRRLEDRAEKEGLFVYRT